MADQSRSYVKRVAADDPCATVVGGLTEGQTARQGSLMAGEGPGDQAGCMAAGSAPRELVKDCFSRVRDQCEHRAGRGQLRKGQTGTGSAVPHLPREPGAKRPEHLLPSLTSLFLWEWGGVGRGRDMRGPGVSLLIWGRVWCWG